MNILKALVTATVLATGPASAYTGGDSSGSGDLNLKIENGVATLLGSVDSSSERILAERLVAKMDGVEQVHNLLTYSS